ncbi:MAG: Ppx/GppA family phosphatase, partial [Gemmatimonadales bacterium]
MAGGSAQAVTRARAAASARLAAIDVGSNSIRLLIATYDPKTGLAPIDEIKAQPRLAQGLAATGMLDPEAIERALVALRRMADVAKRRGATRIAAVATAAVREAKNGDEFVRRVRDEIGLPLQVISTAHEAQLSYRSVRHHFRLDNTKALVADIGGGSLELVGAVDGLVELSR